MVHLSTAQQATKHTRCFRAIGRILEQDAATKIATVKIAGKLCTGQWVKTSIIVIKTNLTLIIRVKLFGFDWPALTEDSATSMSVSRGGKNATELNDGRDVCSAVKPVALVDCSL